MKTYAFETDLAQQAAMAFSSAASLGCCVTLAETGETLCAYGQTCARCALCQRLGRDEAVCARTHLYGMRAAERFGGGYVYFCGRGLTFIVAPIAGRFGGEARVTAGPFLMVDAEDFVACELGGQAQYLPLVEAIPSVAPDKAHHLSDLLSMAVGFLNNASATAAMRERAASGELQGQISAYILETKADAPVYPYDKERALLRAMLDGDRPAANRLLNELLGHILVLSGASFPRVKAHVNALLVAMIRAIAEHGVDAREAAEETESCFLHLQAIADMEALCLWLTGAMNRLMTRAFEFADARHAGAIRRCALYIRENLAAKLTLRDLADVARLSPAYLSTIFKTETGRTLRRFIIEERLKKAEALLRYDALSLNEIALATGFQDQGYFTRSFTKAYGVSPGAYRRSERK